MATPSRGTVFLAMIVSMTLGNMPWYNFSALLQYIAAEFNLTAADTGAILAAFQLGYVIVVGGTGWLADRVSLKKIVFWATLLTGVSATAFAWLAHDLYSILILRLITGLSAGAIYVPGMALLSRWYPSHQRGMALGIYTGAMVAAYAGGYLVASWLAAGFGWRVGIVATSLPAVAAAGVVWLWVADRELDTAAPAPAAQPGPTEAPALAAPAGGYGGPALITTGYVGHMWELYAFWGWMGPFLVASALARGMEAADAARWGGAVAAGIILLGSVAASLWGMVGDRLGRTRAIMLAGSLSACAELGLGFLYGHSLALVVLATAWIGFWVVADTAVYKAGLTEMVAPRVQGLSLGLQSVVGFGVTIVSPWFFGEVMEYYNGAVHPTQATVWGPGFLVLGLGALLAPLAGFWLRRHQQAALMAGGRR